MRRVRLILLLALLLPSCATALRGTDQYFALSTEPPYATVQVNEEEYSTPVVLKLPRNEDARLLLSKEGYRSEELRVSHTYDLGVIYNCGLCVAAPVGAMVDLADGAAATLEPGQRHVQLTAIGGEAGPTAPSTLPEWDEKRWSEWNENSRALSRLVEQTDAYANTGSFLTTAGVVTVALSIAAFWAHAMACPSFSEEDSKDCRDRNASRLNAWAAAFVVGAGGAATGIGFYIAAGYASQDADHAARQANLLNEANPVPAIEPDYKPEWIQMEMRMKY